MASNTSDFITQDQWDTSEKYDGSDHILKWSDVPQHIIFFLHMIEDKQDMKFKSYILHFSDRNEIMHRAFAPSHFVKEIRRRREPDTRPYFVSHGLVEVGNKNIAKFEISFKKEDKTWNIFQ